MTIMTLFKMTSRVSKARVWAMILAAGLLTPVLSQAQYFDYATSTSGRGALLAGFRKPGVGTYELVVKAGNISDLLAVPAGTTIPIGTFTPGQLAAAFSDLNNLSWSVMGTFYNPEFGTWSGFHGSTLWFTLPRGNVAVPTAAPARRSYSSQSAVMVSVDSIGTGAHNISTSLGTTNSNNNLTLVREPADGDPHTLSYNLDATSGLLANMPASIENTTPASFTAAVRSDLYQSVPNGYADPNSGTTSGAAYYAGYFTFNPDGTLTFTRASGTVPPPPAPQITHITRAGNTSTISFTTASGSYTYSLRYTNAAGLTAPVSTWPVAATTVTGDGTVKSLADTTTEAGRFYRVSAQ
jgi:hypothetical protein